MHEDGAIEVISPWFPLVEFDAALLDVADARRVAVSCSELTFRCTNGGATYSLGARQGGGSRVGRLVREW